MQWNASLSNRNLKLIILVFLVSLSLKAQTWQHEGSADFGTGWNTGLAFDANNTPYVTFGWGGVGVMKFNGTNWVSVGSGGVSGVNCQWPYIATDNTGTPFVVYADNAINNQTTVKKFDGTNWVTVGTPGFSAGNVAYSTIVFNSSGTPYVAYRDGGNLNKPSVMKFNGTSWVNVGPAGFANTVVNYLGIALDPSGNPYVCWGDGYYTNNLTVYKYNGSSWAIVGSPGFSAGQAFYNSIAISSTGTPYVAYQDGGNGNYATVMKYDGTNWVNVGNAGFSAGAITSAKIILDVNDTPYVVFSDGGNSNYVTVMKYDGTNWVNVGNAGFSAVASDYTNIAINSIGTIYVSYASGVSVNVMKFVNTTPTLSTTAVSSITSSSAICGGNITNDGGTSITSRGVVWSTSSSPTLALSTKSNNGSGTGVYSSTITGLSIGTTYYVRAYSTNAAGGIAYGNEVTFTTSTAPILTSSVISSLTGTSASSGGNISSDGGASVTVRGVIWSTSTNPTIILSTKTNDGTGTGAFTSSITGMNFNTTYYLRAYATNSIGTAYGNEISFTTNASSIVTLDYPSTLAQTKIVISANAVSDGGANITERGIILSKILNPTISNGTKQTDNGTGLGSFSGTFTGLKSGTKYYLRSYAINSDGISYSDNLPIITVDADGITSADENKAPNGDGNGDGIPDESQENVVSLVGISDNIVTIACLNATQITNTSNYTNQTSSDYTYPFGVFAYSINASSATVTMYFHGTSSLNNYVYRKLSANGRWINFENATFGYTYINHVKTATVTLELTDGDPASDADGIVNGIIVDPGGPALSVADASSIPIWNWKHITILMLLISVSVYKFKDFI